MIELLDFLVRTVEEALDIIRSQSELLAMHGAFEELDIRAKKLRRAYETVMEEQHEVH